MSTRPGNWKPRIKGIEQDVERYEAVAAFKGFAMIDARGRLVCYNSGIPRLYVASDQARWAMGEGRQLVPITIAPTGFAASLPAPTPIAMHAHGTNGDRRYAQKLCAHCRQPFMPTGSRALYCSTPCRKAA